MTSEFELIDAFVGALPHEGAGMPLGPGDDAALLRASRGHDLCATVDEVREGVHFTRRFSLEDIGHKALAVNLSDLAAMGARPRWFLCALELPHGSDRRSIVRIAAGMMSLAGEHGCLLAGGNLCRGPGIAITVTALGEVPRGRALRRDGLRPGDLLAVTGALGGAALGLQRLSRGGGRAGALRQLRPAPRVRAGLSARGLASAAIDVSDGLLQDLGHLCERSGCGAEVDPSRLPLDPALRGRPDGLALALGGGEDYELILGVPPRRFPLLRRRIERAGVPLTVIGEATRRPGLRLLGAGGAPALPAVRGFRHF